MGCGPSAVGGKESAAARPASRQRTTEEEPEQVPVVDFSCSGHADRRLSHSSPSLGADPRCGGGSPVNNVDNGSLVSAGAFSLQSRSTSSRKSEDCGTNPLILVSRPLTPDDRQQDEHSLPAAHAVCRPALNSLSVFSPTSLCDRAEFVRRYRGGYSDDNGLYFPTPEERHSTLEEELRAVRSGGDPADVITGRGALWVHQYLNDGLPSPLEAFRGELYDASDNARLARFQQVAEQITGLCFRLLQRRSTVLDIDMCLARATELVKQSGRTPCTDRLKVSLQQQMVKLHDLRVAVQHSDAILGALRCDDFNHLRTIFDARVNTASGKKEHGAHRHVALLPPSENPASPDSSTPFHLASFSEFVQTTLRQYVEYSLLTTISVAKHPSRD